MPGTPGADIHFFSNAYVLVLLQWMKSVGVSEKQVLGDSGLDPLQLKNIDERIAESTLFSLIQNAMEHSGIAGFGLQFGPRITLASHGILGQALMSSKDVRQAMSVLLKYQPLIFNEAFIEMKETADSDAVHFDLLFPVLESAPIDLCGVEIIFSCIATSFSQLVPENDLPMVLNFAHPAPEWAQDYNQVFGSEVIFDAPQHRFSIPRSVLDQTLVFANSALAEIFEQQCEIQLAKLADEKPYCQKVRKYLLARPGVWPNIDDTAAALFTSVRSLRRHLAAEGASFKQLLEDIRCDLAKEYLKQDKHSVSEIADFLGYSDLSNFRRAFQRWTGESPKRAS